MAKLFEFTNGLLTSSTDSPLPTPTTKKLYTFENGILVDVKPSSLTGVSTREFNFINGVLVNLSSSSLVPTSASGLLCRYWRNNDDLVNSGSILYGAYELSQYYTNHNFGYQYTYSGTSLTSPTPSYGYFSDLSNKYTYGRYLSSPGENYTVFRTNYITGITDYVDTGISSGDFPYDLNFFGLGEDISVVSAMSFNSPSSKSVYIYEVDWANAIFSSVFSQAFTGTGQPIYCGAAYINDHPNMVFQIGGTYVIYHHESNTVTQISSPIDFTSRKNGSADIGNGILAGYAFLSGTGLAIIDTVNSSISFNSFSGYNAFSIEDDVHPSLMVVNSSGMAYFGLSFSGGNYGYGIASPSGITAMYEIADQDFFGFSKNDSIIIAHTKTSASTVIASNGPDGSTLFSWSHTSTLAPAICEQMDASDNSIFFIQGARNILPAPPRDDYIYRIDGTGSVSQLLNLAPFGFQMVEYNKMIRIVGDIVNVLGYQDPYGVSSNRPSIWAILYPSSQSSSSFNFTQSSEGWVGTPSEITYQDGSLGLTGDMQVGYFNFQWTYTPSSDMYVGPTSSVSLTGTVFGSGPGVNVRLRITDDEANTYDAIAESYYAPQAVNESGLVSAPEGTRVATIQLRVTELGGGEILDFLQFGMTSLNLVGFH